MSNQVINNILNQIQPDSTADILEKGKKASIGEIRTWNNGKRYQKTVNGWVPVKSSGEKQKPKPEQEQKTESSKEPSTRNAEKVKAIQDWIGDDASEQEISDVLDAIAEFVPDNALKISGSSSPRQEQVKIQKRIDAIMDTYREHFDHYDGTDSMSDDTLKSILWGVLMDKKNS